MNHSHNSEASAAMTKKKDFSVSLVLLIVVAGFSQPAFAYLDPSTGSMIVSAILGIFATLGLAVKTYWYKLKSFFRGKPTTAAAEPDAQAAEKAEQNSQKN